MANATNYGVYQSFSWVYAPKNHGYLGIQFQIEGETHYGWARLNVAYTFEGKDIDGLLTGYYQSKPGTLILAGDEGRGGEGSVISMTNPSEPRAEGQKTLGALALGSAGSAQLLPRCPY